MDVNWVRVYNRLFEVINSEGEAYFSGSRFISKVREMDPYFPDYSQYMAKRRVGGKSSSRKDYFYDIFMSFDEANRLRVLNAILEEAQHVFPDKIAEIQNELGGVSAVPPARVAPDAWSAERLNNYLHDIDVRISAGNYESAVALAYTCLEGFLKAFVKRNVQTYAGSGEIIELSRTVRGYLQNTIELYPDEALNMLNHVAHTVDRARNRFSEVHFDEQAGRWLAVFVRDLVNAEIRLLLHFMGPAKIVKKNSKTE